MNNNDQVATAPIPPADGLRAKPRKLPPDVERTKLWSEVWHKLADRLLSAPFLAFFLVLLVVAAGLWFVGTKSDVKDIMEFWKLILPVVTLYVGYAIGKGKEE
jgi:hypothetical protein